MKEYENGTALGRVTFFQSRNEVMDIFLDAKGPNFLIELLTSNFNVI